MTDIDRHISAFTRYVDRFRNGDAALLDVFDFKYEHSLRVLENACQITESLSIPENRARLCHIAALVHDIGRFPQYTRYKTLDDQRSEDHGLLGSREVLDNRLPAGLDEDELRVVAESVLLHNKRSLPADLPEDVRFIVSVVRDADKLDIIKVLLGRLHSAGQSSSELTLNLKPHPTAYTTAVFDDVMNGRNAPYDRLCWANDLTIAMCAWVYDLNFPVSRTILVDQGLLDRLFDALPRLPEMGVLERRIRAFLGTGRDAV